MPRSMVCPTCGGLAESRRYVTSSGRPVKPGTSEHLEDLDVWECECGWAEDVVEP